MERGVRGGGEEGGLEGGEGGERDTDPHERSRPEVGGLAPMGGIGGASRAPRPQPLSSPAAGGESILFLSLLFSVATLA